MKNDINYHLKKKNSILFYQEDLKQHYINRAQEIKAVYIQTPRKGKTAYEQILKTLQNDAATKNMTISKMIEEITEKSKRNVVHIYIDNFEQMTRREVENYKELEQEENITLIANIKSDREFVDSDFLSRFIIIDDENFKNNRSQSINVTYPLLLLLSALIFIIFMKIHLTPLRYITSALWFVLLMYRSFYYMVK